MPAPIALFDSLIDYAGLFPPANLAMADAVRNYAAYRCGPQAAQLGRFVLPLARLSEFEAIYTRLPAAGQAGWTLSGLASEDPLHDSGAIEVFNSRQLTAHIVSIETKAAKPADVTWFTAAFSHDLEVWVEVPANGEIAPFIAAIKTANRHAKIRTGGITADAFPSAARVAGFLAACRDAQVVCKATAGLHHPLRGEYRLTYEPGSPSGAMFGFLNVFLAAVLLHGGGTVADATLLLSETDAGAFVVSAIAIGWRQHSFSSSQITAARQSLCRSFGSCSFTEPIEGLQQLRWL
jgi:hypothetical protein